MVLGKRSITADTALRLSRYFGLSERYWLNLQSRYDLELEKDRLGERLDRDVKAPQPADGLAGAASHQRQAAARDTQVDDIIAMRYYCCV